MTPDEQRLRDLLAKRAACLAKHRVAQRSGAVHARLHAIELELAQIVETIREHCERTGLPVPPEILRP